MSGEDVVSSIFATAKGGGACKGMVARWDYSGVNVDKTHELSARGFIVETKVGSGYFPLQVQATRTERIEFHSGLITTPPAQPPYHSGAIATVDIVEEVAQVSFLGLATAESVLRGLRGLCGSFSWGLAYADPGLTTRLLAQPRAGMDVPIYLRFQRNSTITPPIDPVSLRRTFRSPFFPRPPEQSPRAAPIAQSRLQATPSGAPGKPG